MREDSWDSRGDVVVSLTGVVEGEVGSEDVGGDISAASRKLDNVSRIGVSWDRRAGGDRE